MHSTVTLSSQTSTQKTMELITCVMCVQTSLRYRNRLRTMSECFANQPTIVFCAVFYKNEAKAH